MSLKSRIMALAIVLMLLLGVLFTLVPMTRVSANPSNSYTPADYINAMKKAADRLVALQDAAISDYGWDWDVTGLSSHTGNPSATNIYGVTALGLIDAHGRTGTVQYSSAAKSVADFMKYGDPSSGDFYNGHDSYYWGFSFDYRFLVGFSSMSGDAGYNDYALAAWAWQKANISDYYGDGNQTALYDWYVNQVNHGYAGWSASDWGLAAYEMGDTVWAQHMASVVSSNIADIINGTTPGGSSRYKDLGMAWALKLFVTVDPTTYSSDITNLKSHLEALDQNALGYWSDGNPEGDAQTTAYVVMGLWAAGEYSSAGKGAEWLLASQMTDGGWTASPIEYSETDSEAMQALTEVFLPLTVVSAYDSPSPSSGLIPVGTSVTASVTSPVAGTVGTQYVCAGWTGTGSVSSGSGTTVTFTMTQPSIITWNWKTQYYLTVTSLFGAPTGQGWYDAGSTASASVTQPADTPGSQILNLGYVGTGSAPTGSGTSVSFIIASPSSITWNWEVQHYLTVNNGGHGQTSGEGWYDDADEATFSISPTIVGGGNGIRYVFTGWSSHDVRGYTGPSPSHSVFMFNPITETANWKTQCYLTVVSPYGVISGTAWYDNGTTAYATLANGTVDIVPGSVRAVFTGWGGNASGTGLTSNPISMDKPKTAVATWKIQYYLTVATDPSKLVPVPGEGWEDNGTQIGLAAPQYVPNATGSAGVRYRFGYWDIDGTSQGGANSINVQMNASHTATAHYVLQYLVTFSQSGVESDFSGTVVTVDNSTYGASTLPSSFWYDNGSTHTFAFQSPLPIALGAQYNWTSTTGMSTSQSGSIIITGSGTVTGNYGARVAFAVTNVVDNCTWVYQGRPVTVNVTVKNDGNVPETVQVILCYNATDDNATANGIVGTQNVSVPVQESGSITFVWNTTGVPYCHNYTFTEFSSIPAGSSLTGNTLTGGSVRVRIMGDINNDDKVDMKDIGIAAHAFGSNPADPRWNPDADISGDGKVDMRDVAVAARNFGQHG